MAWNTPEDWDYKEAPGSSKLNEQIRDNLNYLKSSLPAGVMMEYGGAVAPDQWLLCNGAAVSRTTYAALYAAIGVTFGVGDGSSTFNLPDFRGRTSIGAGQGTGLTNRILATQTGAETHTLTVDETPAHAHEVDGNVKFKSTGGENFRELTEAGTGTNDVSTGSIGGGAAHNNMQPSLAANKIIKY